MNKAIANNTNRDRSIDAARGFSLFLVVLAHAYPIPHYFTDFFIITFFFLSGYLYKPGRSYLFNIKKKAQRVLLPYMVNSVVLLAVCMVLFSMTRADLPIAIQGIFYSRYWIDGETRLMIAHNSPLWYFTAFFSTSLLFHAVVDRFTQSLRDVFLLIIFLITVNIALTQIPILLPWSLELVPFFCIMMFIGYLFRKNNINLDYNWTAIILLLFGYIALSFSTDANQGFWERCMGWGG